MPPSIQRSNAKHYKSDTVTEVKEFEGAAPAARAAGLGGGRRLRARLGAPPRPAVESGVRITHVGGPTALAKIGGLPAAASLGAEAIPKHRRGAVGR